MHMDTRTNADVIIENYGIQKHQAKQLEVVRVAGIGAAAEHELTGGSFTVLEPGDSTRYVLLTRKLTGPDRDAAGGELFIARINGTTGCASVAPGMLLPEYIGGLLRADNLWTATVISVFATALSDRLFDLREQPTP